MNSVLGTEVPAYRHVVLQLPFTRRKSPRGRESFEDLAYDRSAWVIGVNQVDEVAYMSVRSSRSSEWLSSERVREGATYQCGTTGLCAAPLR